MEVAAAWFMAQISASESSTPSPGLGSLVVSHAHGTFGTLDGGRGLLELDEVDAVGVLVVPHLDNLNVVALVDLAV